MSHESGIAPVPRIPLIGDIQEWSVWSRWFELLTEAIYRIRTHSVELTPASIPGNAESVQTFTVDGLSTTDVVTVNKQGSTPGVDLVQAWASAPNTLSLKYRNITGAAVIPASETYLITTTRV